MLLASINSRKTYKLSDVLRISNFRYNLMSVTKITKDLNCAIIFLFDIRIFQDLKSRKLIGVGKLKHFSPTFISSSCSTSQTASSASIWHMHSGHVPLPKLRHIASLDCIILSQIVCYVCHRSKQTRLPFPASINKSTRCFFFEPL